MATKQTPVVVFQEILLCDLCDAEMKPTGAMLASNPPQYPHVCTECGMRTTEWEQYPRIIYQRGDLNENKSRNQ